MDPEVVITTRYDTAVRTAANFLSVFLGKCGAKNNDEVDYRPLFENFVQVSILQIHTNRAFTINFVFSGSAEYSQQTGMASC